MTNAKQLWLLVGGNGAGKSTFYRLYLEPLGLPFVNADILARIVYPEAPEAHSYEAAKLAERQSHRSAQSGPDRGTGRRRRASRAVSERSNGGKVLGKQVTSNSHARDERAASKPLTLKRRSPLLHAKHIGQVQLDRLKRRDAGAGLILERRNDLIVAVFEGVRDQRVILWPDQPVIGHLVALQQ